jgi:coenzyme F420-reducing hydrogenase delta subunit
MKAFQDGADGVLVSGCHFGDCHYLEGNYKCAKRMFLVKNVLKNIGLNDNRLRMTFVSASEGAKWGMVMEDVVKTVKELGPSPLAEKKN